MTNFRRTLATVAALAGLLAPALLGASPAQAAPAGYPPITPIGGGSGTPSLPPGTVFRPIVQLPSCANALMPQTIPATAFDHPGFGLLGSSTTTIAATAAPLVAIASADRHITCVWGAAGRQVRVTFTATKSGDYATLEAWYRANARWSSPGAGCCNPGTSADTMYVLGNALNGSTVESAFLSPDGWWITMWDQGLNVTPYFLMDATEKFLLLNPGRS